VEYLDIHIHLQFIHIHLEKDDMGNFLAISARIWAMISMDRTKKQYNLSQSINKYPFSIFNSLKLFMKR